MSYTSKYTGEEIDILLDKIHAGGGSMTTLWEGKATSSTTVPLSDHVENYDFIILEAWFCSSSETPGTVCTETIRVANHLEGNGNNMNIFTSKGFGVDLGEYRNSATDHYGSLRINIKNSEVVVGTYYGTTFNKENYLKSVMGIKLNGSDSIPTGNIISFMGTMAPTGYLICDGAELNIVDYPKLANHFETQFGSKNYFGGDGSTTFAVPDLRNEFLRGQGDLSGNIGEHQDGTAVPISGMSALGSNSPLFCVMGSDNSPTWETYKSHGTKDCDESATMSSTYYYVRTTKQGGDYQTCNGRVRPTNVAVLYCIKY